MSKNGKSTKMEWLPGDLRWHEPGKPLPPSDTIDYAAYAQAEEEGLPYPSEVVDEDAKKPLDTPDA